MWTSADRFFFCAFYSFYENFNEVILRESHWRHLDLIQLSPDQCSYGSTAAIVAIVVEIKVFYEVVSDVPPSETPQVLDMKSTVVLEPHVVFFFMTHSGFPFGQDPSLHLL